MMTAKEIQHANQQAFLQFCTESVPELKPTIGNFQKCYHQLLADGVEPDQVIPSHAYGASFFKVENQLEFKIQESKPTKLRIDDSNAPGRTGRMTTAEKHAEALKIQQQHEGRRAVVNHAATRRARLEAETRIAQYQEYKLGKVDHAATQIARKRMLAELDKSNPREL